MTDANDTLERDTLYITDAEMIRRMGVPEKIARDAIREKINFVRKRNSVENQRPV